MRALLLLFTLLPSLATAEIYRWTDAQGRVHFSQRPQAASAERVEVRPQVVQRDEQTRAREQRLEQIHEARRMEQQQATAQASQARAEHEQQCTQLRQRLARLDEGGRFYRHAADGTVEYVSDQEVESTREQLREQVNATCQ